MDLHVELPKSLYAPSIVTQQDSKAKPACRRIHTIVLASLLLSALIANHARTESFQHEHNDFEMLGDGGLESAAKATVFGSQAVEQANTVVKRNDLGLHPLEHAQTKHLLDWNWGPELRRDQSVPYWVGRNWMARFRGTTAMAPVHWQKSSARKSCATAHCADSDSMPQIPNTFGQNGGELPLLSPLKFFPSTGKPTFNTKFIMQQAQKYVSKLDSNFSDSAPEKHSAALNAYVSPTGDVGSEENQNVQKSERSEEFVKKSQTKSHNLLEVEKKLAALQERLKQLEK